MAIGGINGEHMISRKFLKHSSSYAGSHTTSITPEHQTSFGNWGIGEFCPEGSYARDFEIKVLIKYIKTYIYYCFIEFIAEGTVTFFLNI